jgi:FMN phosphatase YigB (HAD superfamily)
MHIGFDFDNTIVSYDALFHKVAKEQALIDDSIPVNKLAVRDYLRATGREDIWTKMQGYVYGARMQEAEAYPGALQVMKKLKNSGHTLTIISHKTRHPYLGKPYDLHVAARRWIENYLCDQAGALISDQHIYFELTKEDKIARIAKSNCDVYIDDLPEILLTLQFPARTRRFLFDPDQHHINLSLPAIKLVSSWAMFETILT